MREVYRIHQDFVQDLFSNNAFGFHGAFLARKKELTFSQVQNDMLIILQQVRDRLQKFESRILKKDSSSGTHTNSETKEA